MRAIAASHGFVIHHRLGMAVLRSPLSNVSLLRKSNLRLGLSFLQPKTFLEVKSHSAAPALDDNNARPGSRSGSLSSPPVQLDAFQKIDVNPPRGTRDFPPEEMRLRNWLFKNFREVALLFGFEEVDFPVLESEALFIRKAGEEIRDQLYSFEDRGNRRVALRPELTPSLARLIIQKRCWRYERMTRGRRREHYQWNMDIVGVPGVIAEAELISCIVTFFKRIGITESDVGFKISSRKVLQGLLRHYSVPDDLFGRVCVIIDKLEKIQIDEIKSELRSAGLSEEAVEDLLQILSLKSLEELEVKLGSSVEGLSELKHLFALAAKCGYSNWIQFDASVVRGLAYYTGIVFEGFDREGKLRAICGGGRYDKLLSTLGGDDTPACGFGFGDAVIVELLKDKNLVPKLAPEIENIVCYLDQDLQDAAALVANKLREKGQRSILVFENKPLKRVFKEAEKVNAERLIIVGSKEWDNGYVAVKILSTSEQYVVALHDLE